MVVLFPDQVQGFLIRFQHKCGSLWRGIWWTTDPSLGMYQEIPPLVANLCWHRLNQTFPGNGERMDIGQCVDKDKQGRLKNVGTLWQVVLLGFMSYFKLGKGSVEKSRFLSGIAQISNPPIRATWSFFLDVKMTFCAYDRKKYWWW